MTNIVKRLFAPLRRHPVAALVAVALVAACGVALAWYLRDQRNLKRGREALARHDFAAAQAWFEKYLKHHSDDIEARLLAAQAARRGGDLSAAEGHLFNAQQQGDVSEASTFEWALLRAQKGESSDIEAYLHEKQGRDAATSVLVLEAAAQGAMKKGRTPLAMEFLDRLLKLEPDHCQGLVLRGRLWHSLHRDENARADLARAIEIQPSGIEARVRYAEVVFELGFVGEAAANFERVLRRSPDRIDAMLGLAKCRVDAHEFDDALEILRKLQPWGHVHLPAVVELGRLHIRMNRPADAEAALMQHSDAVYHDVGALQLLEVALQMQCKSDETRKVREYRLQYEAALRRERPKRDELSQDAAR